MGRPAVVEKEGRVRRAHAGARTESTLHVSRVSEIEIASPRSRVLPLTRASEISCGWADVVQSGCYLGEDEQ